MNSNNHESYWSDYWRNDGSGGEVFVNSQGEKPTYLREYWSSYFNSISAGSTVVDLGCGGGSIFEDIPSKQRDGLRLIATDISQQALTLAASRVNGVETICCDSLSVPLADQSVDVIVSQFGIEYAGLDAFTEASRLLSKNGKLACLCHVAGGYIDQRNELFLEGARKSIEFNFVPTAKRLIEAIFAKSEQKLVAARKEFQVAEKSLATYLQTNQNGIHRHLYAGFQQLYLNYSRYHRKDIIAWLDDMQADIEKNIVKVQNIRSVSLSSSDIKSVTQLLKRKSSVHVTSHFFKIPDTENIIAVAIEAQRS